MTKMQLSTNKVVKSKSWNLTLICLLIKI